MKKAVISVIGKDMVGIIHGVTGILLESKINILDISQTIMHQEIFTMAMVVDLTNSINSFEDVSKLLEKEGERLGVKITVCHEDIFNSMHRI